MVTAAIVATPRRFYPLTNTTASIRRDPLWLGLGITGFAAACIMVYGDLLRVPEIAALVGIALVSMVIGWNIAAMRIDAVGHPRAMIIGRRRRLENLYIAVRNARNIDAAMFMDSENMSGR
jgi:hypothetical protein